MWRYLYLWGDDDCPLVDLKRILLAYLYAIGWKGGALFPTKAEINDPPADGIYKTRMTENDLYTTLGLLQKGVLKRKDKLVSHAGRKSGYLFGIIRGASVLSLKQDADHECYEVVERYAKDAEAIMAVNRCFQDKEQRLGPYRAAYCCGDETAVRSCMPGRKFQKPLPELAVGFIEERVGISPLDPMCRVPSYLLEKVLAWRKPGASPGQELQVSVQLYQIPGYRYGTLCLLPRLPVRYDICLCCLVGVRYRYRYR